MKPRNKMKLDYKNWKKNNKNYKNKMMKPYKKLLLQQLYKKKI